MKNQPNEKFYIYLRKSSEGEDRQVQSLERQADEVQKLVQYQNLILVGTFQESRSAMIPDNRPEFTKMVKGIKAGKANGIVCWHINRLARNPLESGIIQQLLEDGKIKRIVTKDREYSSADNAIIFSVESSLATQYSKDLGKMVKSGMEKKVSQGIFPLQAPIGYLNTKMAEHGSNYIIKDPERFEIVRKIWDMMISGRYVPSQILKIITTETGLKPVASKNRSGKLCLSWLYHMFKNPFYTGMFQYKGQLYPGKHEAMISLDEFDTVQKILGRNGRPRKQRHFFSYTGIITCGECGCSVTATEKSKYIKSKDAYSTYVYYYCTQRKRGINCLSRKILRVKELEDQIVEVMEKVTLSESFINVATLILKSNTGLLKTQNEKIEDMRNKELGNVDKEIKNLLQMRINELINDEEYRREKQIRENKRALLIQKKNESDIYPISVLNNIETKLLNLVNIKDRFIKGGAEDRKAIFGSIGENYTLLGKKLTIVKPLWLEIVERNRKEVETEISWFELNKYIDLKCFSIHFKDVFPIMCALIEEVGTAMQKDKLEQEPYYLTKSSDE